MTKSKLTPRDKEVLDALYRTYGSTQIVLALTGTALIHKDKLEANLFFNAYQSLKGE